VGEPVDHEVVLGLVLEIERLDLAPAPPRTSPPGPDSNEPLRLLHRDIKPANIQLTADGEVKILDFGIAKAEFANREAHTQAYVGGTKGFIAPERLEGQDGPEGDVFSLGVTAHVMLTGQRPTRREMMGLDAPAVEGADADLVAMLDLTARMRSVDPQQRPSAREVEEECSRIRKSSEGPSLRRWAEETVARASALRPDDEMVGSVLSETLAAMAKSDPLASGHELVDSQQTFSPRTPPPAPQSRSAVWAVWGIGALAVGMLAVGAASAVLGTGVLAINLGSDGWQGSEEAPRTRDGSDRRAATTPPPPPTTPSPRPEDPTPQPVAAPQPAPAQPGPQPRPGSEQPAPRPEPAPQPQTQPATQPQPQPAAQPDPAPAAQPAAAAVLVTFTSIPMGAAVVVDGKAVGETPLRDLPLSAGAHKVKMTTPEGSIERTVTVGGRNPQKYMWRGGDKWESIY
jgi:serine/threonine protein kinase